jgi:EAL domain-containing protein (putative c-di-GMP-specific phosphodiesterase class I)
MQSTSSTTTHASEEAISEVLRDGLVRSVYQPIVDLHSGQVVGFEALARGVAGSPLESPDALFGAARSAGRVADLDWLCMRRALEGATGGLHPDQWLFVNVEPEVAGRPLPEELARLIESVHGNLRVMVELTERALTHRPAELLALVRRVRSRGWGVALDDVGADPRSLALMTLLDPDVIKLDLNLVQQRPSADIAEVVAAVNSYAEHSGAVVLAEGLETAEHVHTALAMGATLGQGWRFARPGPLPGHVDAPARPLLLRSSNDLSQASPFDAVAVDAGLLVSTKPLLIEMSKHLEQQALALGPTALVLAAFQHRDYFTARTSGRYVALAQSLALVGALGAGMPAEPAPGVRGAPLADGDPVLGEWDIAVISPHFTAALVARDLGDSGPESRRRFEYHLTYNRDKATAVAKSLMERFVTGG